MCVSHFQPPILRFQKNKNNPTELTRREMELLRLMGERLTLPEMVDKMCPGVQTIHSYRKTLNFKLSAQNTAQLVQKAKALKLE